MKAEAAQKDLEDRIASTHAQLRKLQLELDALKRQGGEQVSGNGAESNHEDGPAEREPADGNKSKWPLLQEEYKRYGRQMIVEQIGLKGTAFDSRHPAGKAQN
jgi:adenylyltransferase/sulfurtransferase